jgi:hypothetical protein
MFVVHGELEGKPDMEFRMHKSGRHYFDPRDSEFTFVNTVSENKAGDQGSRGGTIPVLQAQLSVLEGL